MDSGVAWVTLSLSGNRWFFKNLVFCLSDSNFADSSLVLAIKVQDTSCLPKCMANVVPQVVVPITATCCKLIIDFFFSDVFGSGTDTSFGTL